MKPTPNQKKAGLVSIVGAAAATLLLAIVPHHEGTVLRTYKDPVGILTSCNGHTGPELKMGQVFTPEECSDTLAGDLIIHAQGVRACIKKPMADHEIAAFTSLAFNIGVKAFCGSTVARRFNAGDQAGACTAIDMWNKAGGRVWPGLVKRRAAERALCEGRA
jgi:lysozyme